MLTLTDDEVNLLRSLLTALRAIKVRDIDKALVILSKQKWAWSLSRRQLGVGGGSVPLRHSHTTSHQ